MERIWVYYIIIMPRNSGIKHSNKSKDGKESYLKSVERNNKISDSKMNKLRREYNAARSIAFEWGGI